MAKTVVILLLAFALAGCTQVVTDVTTVSDPGRYEVSLPGSGVTLGGILFRPASTSKLLPAIIVLHGWAPPGVPGAARVESTARRLSEQGYVALALSMRGWPPSSGWDDCGTRQPDDVAKAADWLATLPGVNADSIGVMGFSLGGQVALLSGARSDRIKAIVAYFPITDVQRWGDTTSNAGIRYFYVPLVCGTGDGTPQSMLQSRSTLRSCLFTATVTQRSQPSRASGCKKRCEKLIDTSSCWSSAEGITASRANKMNRHGPRPQSF